MLSIAGNILPIFFLILIGFLFKQSGFPGNKIWVPAERLAYYVLLPALIIRNLTNTDLSTLPTGPMALTILSLGASMPLIILIIKPILSKIKKLKSFSEKLGKGDLTSKTDILSKDDFNL